MDKPRTIPIVGLMLLWLASAAAAAEAVTFSDDDGRAITLRAPATRIVSLVLMVTDLIEAMGAGNRLVAADGEVVFYDPLVKAGRTAGVQGVGVRQDDIAHGLAWLERLGTLTGRFEAARRLEAEIKGDLAVAAAKTDSLGPGDRLSMLGLKVVDGHLRPLTGPYQIDLVVRAGGRAAAADLINADGELQLEALRHFDPDLIFAPLEQRREVLAHLDTPGWRQVDAVTNRRIFFFPASLLDHRPAGAGYLVNALASRAYPQLYTDPAHQVRPNRIFRTRRVPVDLAMVAKARVCHHFRYDFLAKTLVVDLSTPQKVLSTLEGMRTGVTTVGNHFAPPPCWWLAPHSGPDHLRKEILPVIDRPLVSTSLLFTGADMDCLAVETADFREMRVVALVTAGVRSNAMRLSKDTGNYYEPGTINIILMTSMRLSERAMSRALVTATEAKTAALWDLDIRSSYTPRRHAATGTGTDNLIVVQNSGAETRVDNSGGHTKMGELIATAVYKGVQQAIAKQNGITAERKVTERLAERRIEIDRLVATTPLSVPISRNLLTAAIHAALKRPEVADLLTAAMSLDDAAGRGLTRISRGFTGWCRQTAGIIAGHSLPTLRPLIEIDPQTPALGLALNAVWNGALAALESSLSQQAQ
jgi:adenosylcobinamide amidohydrolase/ABC-type Fe3+-hydroxamate transport system substrate-binding protein